jgi:hypothetical protein
LFLAGAHGFDQPGQLPEGIDAFRFQRGDLVFVAFQALANRFEQAAQSLGAGFFAFGKAILRAFEEGFLRAFEHFAAGCLEFLAQRFLRRQQ